MSRKRELFSSLALAKRAGWSGMEYVGVDIRRVEAVGVRKGEVTGDRGRVSLVS